MDIETDKNNLRKQLKIKIMTTKTKLFSAKNVLRFFGIVLAAFALLILLFAFLEFAPIENANSTEFRLRFMIIANLIYFGIFGISLIIVSYLARKLPIGLILFLNLIMIWAVAEVLITSRWWISPHSLILLLSAILIGLLIYTIVSFIKSKPNALFLGKLFLGLLLLDWVLNPILAALCTEWRGNICLSVAGWCWASAWNRVWVGGYWILISIYIIALAYLYCSKQIQTLFPKEQRTIFTIDKVIAIVAVIAIVVRIFWHIIPHLCW